MAMYHDLHRDAPWHDGLFQVWTKEQSALTPFRFDMGVSIWLAREDLTPDDDWLEQRRDVLGSVAPGEADQVDHQER